MPELDFPDNPVIGQVYNTGLKTWKWSGYGWTTLGTGDGTVIATSEAPPADPSIGDLWFNTTTAVLFIYYVDGDSTGQWVTVSTSTNADTSGANVVSQDNPPSTPEEGDLWFNTVTGVLYIYHNDDNTLQWVTVTQSTASTGEGGASVVISDTAPSSPDIGDLWFDSTTTQVSAVRFPLILTPLKVMFLILCSR